VYQWDTTDRGASWTRSKLRAEAFNHEPAIRIGDLWVRMDEYWDTIESSPDKKHWQSAWQSQGGPYAQPTRVRLTSVGAIAVGSVGDYEGGLILRSVDGVEWTQSVGWADLDAAAAVSDVAESGPAIVAVGYRFSGSSPQPYVLVRLP
jgi:hypothetical protein